jgi:large subunit ribosomal protein L6
MSRIGRKSIAIPKGVSINVQDGTVTVKGPKAELARPIAPYVSIEVVGDVLHVHRQDVRRQLTKSASACHGLMRALLNNMVTGVSKGFERNLIVDGVGYKAEVKGKSLHLNLGYSHPIDFPTPEGLTIEVKTGKELIVSIKGADKEKVGQVAAEIRSLRPPDSYKGKGIRYDNEVLRLKAGKK